MDWYSAIQSIEAETQATVQKNLQNVVARDRAHTECQTLIDPIYLKNAVLANHGNKWASGCLCLGRGRSRESLIMATGSWAVMMMV